MNTASLSAVFESVGILVAGICAVAQMFVEKKVPSKKDASKEVRNPGYVSLAVLSVVGVLCALTGSTFKHSEDAKKDSKTESSLSTLLATTKTASQALADTTEQFKAVKAAQSENLDLTKQATSKITEANSGVSHTLTVLSTNLPKLNSAASSALQAARLEIKQLNLAQRSLQSEALVNPYVQGVERYRMAYAVPRFLIEFDLSSPRFNRFFERLASTGKVPDTLTVVGDSADGPFSPSGGFSGSSRAGPRPGNRPQMVVIGDSKPGIPLPSSDDSGQPGGQRPANPRPGGFGSTAPVGASPDLGGQGSPATGAPGTNGGGASSGNGSGAQGRGFGSGGGHGFGGGGGFGGFGRPRKPRTPTEAAQDRLCSQLWDQLKGTQVSVRLTSEPFHPLRGSRVINLSDEQVLGSAIISGPTVVARMDTRRRLLRVAYIWQVTTGGQQYNNATWSKLDFLLSRVEARVVPRIASGSALPASPIAARFLYFALGYHEGSPNILTRDTQFSWFPSPSARVTVEEFDRASPTVVSQFGGMFPALALLPGSTPWMQSPKERGMLLHWNSSEDEGAEVLSSSPFHSDSLDLPPEYEDMLVKAAALRSH